MRKLKLEIEIWNDVIQNQNDEIKNRNVEIIQNDETANKQQWIKVSTSLSYNFAF